MVQMPSGIPVACVAINGAKNAALLAIQMLALCLVLRRGSWNVPAHLALNDADLLARLEDFRCKQTEKVLSATI